MRTEEAIRNMIESVFQRARLAKDSGWPECEMWFRVMWALQWALGESDARPDGHAEPIADQRAG